MNFIEILKSIGEYGTLTVIAAIFIFFIVIGVKSMLQFSKKRGDLDLKQNIEYKDFLKEELRELKITMRQISTDHKEGLTTLATTHQAVVTKIADTFKQDSDERTKQMGDMLNLNQIIVSNTTKTCNDNENIKIELKMANGDIRDIKKDIRDVKDAINTTGKSVDNNSLLQRK